MAAREDVAERWIAHLGGEAVGYTEREHPAWSKMPDRFTAVGAEVRLATRTGARLEALYAQLEADALADGTRTLTAWAWERDRLALDALQRRGFGEERRERFWELDLLAEREQITRMAEASRERMRRQGSGCSRSRRMTTRSASRSSSG